MIFQDILKSVGSAVRTACSLDSNRPGGLTPPAPAKTKSLFRPIRESLSVCTIDLKSMNYQDKQPEQLYSPRSPQFNITNPLLSVK